MAFILIVDANQTYANRASDVLSAAGHACGWVTGAEQALALLRWRVPELILLDQAIPGADGGTLPHMLRRAANAPRLPIILLTTNHGPASIGSEGNAVLDEIRKPFDPGFLAWRVDTAFEPSGDAQPAEVQPPSQPKLRSLA